MLRPFVNRTTKWLAELSYGVYLIHWLIVIYLYEFSGLPSNGTLGDLALWMAVVAAALAPFRGALATLVRAADPALGAAPDGRPAADRRSSAGRRPRFGHRERTGCGHPLGMMPRQATGPTGAAPSPT